MIMVSDRHAIGDDNRYLAPHQYIHNRYPNLIKKLVGIIKITIVVHFYLYHDRQTIDEHWVHVFVICIDFQFVGIFSE